MKPVVQERTFELALSGCFKGTEVDLVHEFIPDPFDPEAKSIVEACFNPECDEAMHYWAVYLEFKDELKLEHGSVMSVADFADNRHAEAFADFITTELLWDVPEDPRLEVLSAE